MKLRRFHTAFSQVGFGIDNEKLGILTFENNFSQRRSYKENRYLQALQTELTCSFRHVRLWQCQPFHGQIDTFPTAIIYSLISTYITETLNLLATNLLGQGLSHLRKTWPLRTMVRILYRRRKFYSPTWISWQPTWSPSARSVRWSCRRVHVGLHQAWPWWKYVPYLQPLMDRTMRKAPRANRS